MNTTLPRETIAKLEEIFSNVLPYAKLLEEYFLQRENISSLLEMSIGSTEEDTEIGLMNMAEKIANAYQSLCYFPCEPFKKCLKNDFGFKDNDLRWFVPYNEIVNEIQKVNSSGDLYIPPVTVFHLINNYLQSKIFSSVLNLFFPKEKWNGIEISIGARGVLRLEQKRKYQKKSKMVNPVITEYDKALQKIESSYDKSLNKEFYNTDFLSLLKDFSNGKIEKYFFSDFISKHTSALKPNLSKGSKKRMLFPLFKLVLKDENWYSEDQFNDLADEHGQIKIQYRDNYKRYQEKIISKYIL